MPLGMALGQVPKNIFLVAGLVAGAVVLVARRREQARVWTPLHTAFAALIAVSVLSLINSVDIRDSMRGLLKLSEYFLVVMTMRAVIRCEKDVRRVMLFCLISLLTVSFDALIQLLTGKDIIRGYELIENIGLYRVTASFVDSNVFGIYLSALGPLVLGMARYTARGRGRIIYCIAGALLLAASILTYSRPTLLALFISVAIIAVVKKDKIVIGLLLALVVAAPFAAPPSVKDWAKSVDYNAVRFMCNDDRIAAYRNSLHMVRDHPIVGVGVNTFMKRYKEYKEQPEYRGVVTSDYMYAHNNVLHMAGETGLLGVAVFLWFLLVLFAHGVRTWQDCAPGFLKDASLFLLACLAGFLVNGLTESSLYYSRVALIFWYLGGLLVSIRGIRA